MSVSLISEIFRLERNIASNQALSSNSDKSPASSPSASRGSEALSLRLRNRCCALPFYRLLLSPMVAEEVEGHAEDDGAKGESCEVPSRLVIEILPHNVRAPFLKTATVVLQSQRAMSSLTIASLHDSYPRMLSSLKAACEDTVTAMEHDSVNGIFDASFVNKTRPILQGFVHSVELFERLLHNSSEMQRQGSLSAAPFPSNFTMLHWGAVLTEIGRADSAVGRWTWLEALELSVKNFLQFAADRENVLCQSKVHEGTTGTTDELKVEWALLLGRLGIRLLSISHVLKHIALCATAISGDVVNVLQASVNVRHWQLLLTQLGSIVLEWDRFSQTNALSHVRSSNGYQGHTSIFTAELGFTMLGWLAELGWGIWGRCVLLLHRTIDYQLALEGDDSASVGDDELKMIEQPGSTTASWAAGEGAGGTAVATGAGAGSTTTRTSRDVGLFAFPQIGQQEVAPAAQVSTATPERTPERKGVASKLLSLFGRRSKTQPNSAAPKGPNGDETASAESPAVIFSALASPAFPSPPVRNMFPGLAQQGNSALAAVMSSLLSRHHGRSSIAIFLDNSTRRGPKSWSNNTLTVHRVHDDTGERSGMQSWTLSFWSDGTAQFHHQATSSVPHALQLLKTLVFRVAGSDSSFFAFHNGQKVFFVQRSGEDMDKGRVHFSLMIDLPQGGSSGTSKRAEGILHVDTPFAQQGLASLVEIWGLSHAWKN